MDAVADEKASAFHDKYFIDWDTFKADVGLKVMILDIDIAILLKQSILHVDCPIM